ncbi:MAG: hypothetical protein FJ122_05015 [Deltaproteobacteria bacterium]|nr:hypothetical protein [Deltaproteobacteria bacterium]
MLILFLILGILLTPVSSANVPDISFSDIPGWKVSSEIQVFNQKNLYEHINGAADLYLASDFEELKVAEYVNEKKASVIVEAYRHRTPRDAFGIYSQERPPDGNFIAIGAQGYVDKNVLNFTQGSYYVKLNSFDTGAEDREVLQAIAKKVAEGMGEKGGLPFLLSAFPLEGKKGNSEKYLTRNFLGYAFFISTYTAEYDIAGSTFKLFLIEAADKKEAKGIIKKYLRQVKHPERKASEGRYTVSDPHHGVVDLFWKDAYIWGAVDLADADLRSKVLTSFEGNIIRGK